MTLQTTVALYSGLAYLAAAGVCIPTLKVLGPHYPSRITAPWPVIAVGVFIMVALFFRAVTILFPGELVAIKEISWVTPIKATADLVLQFAILDYALRTRAPPPLIERLLSIAASNGISDRGLTEMAFATPASLVADTAASEDRDHPQIGKRWVRVVMLTGAILLITAIVLAVVLNSGARAAV